MLRKRKDVMESFGVLGRFSGGRSDLYIPSRPYPDFSIEREREREMRRREKREEMAVRTKTNQLLRFVIVRIWTVVSKCLFSSNYYCVLRTSFDLFFLVI